MTQTPEGRYSIARVFPGFESGGLLSKTCGPHRASALLSRLASLT
jgi:hypothetical protein